MTSKYEEHQKRLLGIAEEITKIGEMHDLSIQEFLNVLEYAKNDALRSKVKFTEPHFC